MCRGLDRLVAPTPGGLTGTPFRTAGDPIAFVRYEDGAASPHYTYDYGAAIADRARGVMDAPAAESAAA